VSFERDGIPALKEVAMSVIPDNENASAYRNFSSADHVANSTKRAKARENRWVALLIFSLLVWIAILSLLGYGLGWLYYILR
jgi:hypothetical protein